MATTSIAGRDVPIELGPKTIITFSGGRGGSGEAGRWEFWTAGSRGVTARCREGADPGERFRQMEGARGYERYWGIARAADRLSPATVDELEVWLNTHPGDAPHAESGEVGGEKVRVVSEGRNYRVNREAP